jgi:hypothetical protein
VLPIFDRSEEWGKILQPFVVKVPLSHELGGYSGDSAASNDIFAQFSTPAPTSKNKLNDDILECATAAALACCGTPISFSLFV